MELDNKKNAISMTKMLILIVLTKMTPKVNLK